MEERYDFFGTGTELLLAVQVRLDYFVQIKFDTMKRCY